ncbi:MAG: ABC transporter permease [Aigarchaeota archaeon]|nr:ABC transporter permease [Aigarchaeota archaeon]MCX8193652.1 ABC transporter permease [Nitrososphaeria archaeon]MDW7986984.1 ABC transporter permease [Nitrososphaerota archaeon]
MAIGIAFLVGSAILLLAGVNPLVAYYWLFYGAFSATSLVETFVRATPLLLIGLGLAISFTARIWNIGAEGQFYIGATITAVLGLYTQSLPQPFTFFLLLAAAGVSGAAWALPPAILRAHYGINEIITTLMLNYIAIYTVSYLLHNPFRDPVSSFPETSTLPEQIWIPILVPGTRFHMGILLAFFTVPVIYFILRRTAFSMKLEILGSGRKTAEYAGINVTRLIIQSMLISGFLAGVAGGIEVLGIQHKMRLEISPSISPYGYTAIAVALLGYLNPVLIAATSIFLGGIINGSMTMHRMANVPVGMAGIIQAIMIIFIMLGYYLEEKFATKLLERLKQ